jgi:ABC-type transport system substrate-binding protein
VDQLIVDAQASSDDAEVLAMTEEIQALVWEDMPWVSMYFQPEIYAKSKALRDVEFWESIPNVYISKAYMEE